MAKRLFRGAMLPLVIASLLVANAKVLTGMPRVTSEDGCCDLRGDVNGDCHVDSTDSATLAAELLIGPGPILAGDHNPSDY